MPRIVLSFAILFVLLSICQASYDNSSLENFLSCLPDHIDPANPISGFIYTSKNSSFQSVYQAYIKKLEFLSPTTPKPVAIVAANHESHVQATVICAKSNALQIRIRSGGHDFEGLSYTSQVPFIILDMFNLRSIDINIANETAWVQSGAILGELYYNIANASSFHAFPAGVCPTVGVGGHFSIGGWGTLVRKYGLAIDNIIDAQLVDVKGKIVDRNSMGEDVFWAIRGGGGTSFGVVLSWKIKLVRVPEKVTVFRKYRFLEENVTNTIFRWQQVAPNFGKGWFVKVLLNVVDGSQMGQKTIKFTFVGLYLGQIDELFNQMGKSFPEMGLMPQDCYEVSWIESTLFWASYPIGTSVEELLKRPTTKPTKFFKKKSDFVRRVIPKEGLESIWGMMLKTGNVSMQWTPYGGRMDEISETETPFPHRAGIVFMIEYTTIWADEGKKEKQLNLLREMYKGMAPFVSKNPREAYPGYRDLDIGRSPSNGTHFGGAEIYGLKYFKKNFFRLTEVKSLVDPDNFFANEQSIPSKK